MGKCRWMLLAPLAVLLSFSIATQAMAEDQPEPAEGAQLADRLRLEQGKLTDTYRRFTSELLKLAELTRKDDPERAALLEKAVSESGKRGIHDQLGEILDLLDSDLLRDLDDVSGRQEEVEQDLQALLRMLLTENRADKNRNERDRIKGYIKDIDRAIRSQREIGSRSQRGGDPERLAGRQGRLAGRTGEIADKIIENEEASAEAEESDDKSDPDGEEGEPSGEQEGDGQPGESKSGDSNSDAKSGDSNEGQTQDESESSNEADGEPSDPSDQQDGSSEQPSEDSSESSDPSDSKESPPAGDAQPSSPSPGQESSGQQAPSQGQGEGSSQEQGQPSQAPQSDPFPARQRVEEAARKMREAEQKLKDAKQDEAKQPQEEALAQLEKAKQELEEILRQMREEEMEKTLALLEGRFRKMLEMQQAVYDATVLMDKKPQEKRDRADEIEADRLARKEIKIIGEVDKAMVLLREDGTSVALPEAVSQIREDMEMVAERLTDAKVGKLTQDVETDIIEALQEVIGALEKARKDLKEGTPPSPPPGAPAGQPGEPPLVDYLAEIKMIRALQMRVNRRTEQYKEMIDSGEVESEWMAPTIRRLAEREERITDITRDIVLGKNR